MDISLRKGSSSPSRVDAADSLAEHWHEGAPGTRGEAQVIAQLIPYSPPLYLARRLIADYSAE